MQLTLIVSRIVVGASRIIATGSYIARDETTAEVAFAVDDEFQGKGLGGLLLERLALLAARHGFVRFWALTLLENQLMLETFRRSGFPIHSKIDNEYVEIDFSVAPSEDSVSHSEMRDRVFTTASLHPFFQPRSVAVIGASRDTSSIGYRILETLIRGRLPRLIHPVNPNATSIESFRAYPSARQIPPGTDLAIVAIPRDAVLEAVDDCAVAGIRALVVVTAGFAEAGPEGCALQEKLLEKVRGLGMRVVGPSSMGLLNTDVRLNASLSPSLPPRGSVAMSSQSGALGLAMLALARQRHVGISTFVSVGNKADISGNDLLQYWQGDEATRVILLYLESFGNPRRFARIARGVSLSKPIVVVKAGRRAASVGDGRPDAATLVAGDAAVDALFRQTGVIRAETLDEMFDLAAALDRQPLPAGRRVAILTDASGPGILCAGACEAGRLFGPSVIRFDGRAARGLSLARHDDRQSARAGRLGLGGAVSPGPRDAPRRSRSGCRHRDPYAARRGPIGRDAGGDPAGHRSGARGGRHRQAGPGVPRGEGRRRHADGARRREHSDVRVSRNRLRACSARSRRTRSGEQARTGSFPTSTTSILRSARGTCRRAIEDRGAGLALGGRDQSGPSSHAPSRRSGGVARTADEAAELAREASGSRSPSSRPRTKSFTRRRRGAVHLNVADEAAVRRAFEAIRRFLEADGTSEAMEGRAGPADGQRRRRGDGGHVRGPLRSVRSSRSGSAGSTWR